MFNSGISQPTNTDPLNPSNNGYPEVDSSFTTNYDSSITSLLGMITLGDAVYNYQRDGSTLAAGAPVARRFAEDSYEMYAQDTWKVKPNLTLTLGLRYSLFSPPWETNGLQVGTNVNLGDWFNARGKGMLQGIPSNAQPLISYQWAGPANGKPGYYGWDTKDFGPKVAFAWSPNPSGRMVAKTVRQQRNQQHSWRLWHCVRSRRGKSGRYLRSEWFFRPVDAAEQPVGL